MQIIRFIDFSLILKFELFLIQSLLVDGVLQVWDVVFLLQEIDPHQN